MANSVKSGNIMFLGNEFVLSDLVSAFEKANTSFIEPDAKFHTVEFDQANISDEWKKKHKQPVLTVYEGMYVFLYRPDDFAPELEFQDLGAKSFYKLLRGFKTKFVTKYNFNRAKYEAPPPVSMDRQPVYEDRHDDRFNNRPQWAKPNQGRY